MAIPCGNIAVANESIRKPQSPFIIGQSADELMATMRRVDLALKEMEEGFLIDVPTLTDLKRDYENVLSGLKKEIQAKPGKTVRINSNRELGDLLFRDFRLPSLRSTPSGKCSVAIGVLERLCDLYSDVFPFLRPVIEFKNLQSSIKAVKTILKKLDLQSRIHPEFNQSTCPTGRIYSYIQNLSKEVRKVLIPDDEENIFIELDWSQQELRILGVISQEPVFLDCFARNEDLHRRVISEMFHKPISEVTDEERKTGKTINYALIYGQEAPGLAWKLNIPLERAQELIDQYFLSLPTIRRFKDEMKETFLTEGCAETVFGRKTQLDITGPNKEKELRRGFNHIIQGTGADILRMTLVRLSEVLKGQQAKLKFCAHDAIYIETKKDISEDMGELARSVMEIEFKGVRLLVAIRTGKDLSMGDA